MVLDHERMYLVLLAVGTCNQPTITLKIDTHELVSIPDSSL